MVNPKAYLETGLQFHGHKCPAMPMGLRTGAAAMNALGVGRTGDSALLALVELGDDHCATCFADGIQVITGCTFGKGNIQKLGYGKWGVTLIDKKTQRAVRVVPKAAVMMENKHGEFIQMRMGGTPPTQVPDDISEPLVEKVMGAAQEQLLDVGPVTPTLIDTPKHLWDAFVCDNCGEFVIEAYGRIRGEQKLCIPCHEHVKG